MQKEAQVPPSETVVETEGLTKYYGAVCGIAGLDLEVRRGEIFGFLGPNGAGKTTTIRILLDLIRPTSGRALIFGRDARACSLQIKSRIGYLPGEYGMYEAMTGREYLRVLAGVRGMKSHARVGQLIDMLGLDVSKKIKSYSHGNKQKLAIVQAFMHDAELLILDEPTSGIDPLVQQVFYRLLEQERERARTVFMSSHNLPEVERVCDRAAVLKQGRLMAVHDISELRKYRVKTVEIEFREDVAESELRIQGVRRLKRNGRFVTLWVDSDINSVLRAISDHPVESLTFRDANLEDVFMEYYES